MTKRKHPTIIAYMYPVSHIEYVAIANALHLEAARRRAVPILFIRRPCQV